MYADDVILVKSFASAVLDRDLKILEFIAEWFVSNDLSLNPAKFQCVLTGSSALISSIQSFNISLYSVSLETFSSARILDLLLIALGHLCIMSLLNIE